MARKSDFISNQINSENPFTSKPDIGEINNPIKEKEFLDNERKGIKIEDYKGYIQEGRESSAIPFSADLDYARALEQSNWEQAGNATMRLLPNTALEIVNQTAALLDIEDYVNSDDEVGNWLSNWTKEQKAVIDEATPIYQENPGEALQVGDFAWWMENGTNLVQSATAFVALGYATGGASLAAITKGTQAAKWLKTLGQTAQLGDQAKKAVQATSALTNATLLNHAEGYGIATDVFNITLQEELAKGTDEVKAKEEAARKAENALNANKVNILLNLSSASMFLKSPKLTRELLKNPSIANTAKKTITEGLQESAEELVNLASQERALEDDFSLEKALEDMFTKEGAESALLGFIGGAGQTMLTTAGRELKLRKDEDGNRISENNLVRQQVVNQGKQIEEWNNMSKSQKMSSISDALMNTKEQTELYNQYNKAETTVEKNQIADKIFFNQAYKAFDTGTTEQFLEVFKGVKELTEEQAEAKGLDPKTYKQAAEEAIAAINSLENTFTESKGYLNSIDIYRNRAELTFLRQETKELEKAKDKAYQDYLADLEDLKLKEKEEEKDGIFKASPVGDLKSWQDFDSITKLIKYKESRKEFLIKEFQNLSSKETQQSIKDKFDAKEQVAIKTNKEIDKQQAKKDEIARKAAAKVKAKIDTTVTTKTNENTTLVKSTRPVKEVKGVKLFDTEYPALDEQFNNILNDTNRTNINKFEALNKVVKGIEQMDENTIPKNIKLNTRAQFDVIKADLVEKIKEEKASQPNPTDDKIRELADTLEAGDLALSQTQSDKIDKTVAILKDVFNDISDKGIDITNFKEVGEQFQMVLGKERFIRLYPKIQGVFNILAKEGKTSSQSYEELFLTVEEQKELTKDNQILKDFSVAAPLYNVFEDELLEELDKAHAQELKNQGYTKYDNDTTSIDVDKAKLEEAHNKIARLDKRYTTRVTSSKTDRFNVLDFVLNKQDLDKNLNNNASPIILDFREINVGDKITFIPRNNVVLENGDVISADEVDNPVMNAPIGIEYNGEILEGAFLHVPDWITADKVRGNVAEQKQKLLEFRQAVLNSPNGITTTITNREDGFPMIDPDGYVNKTKDTMNEAIIAIGKDGKFFTSNRKFITIPKYQAFNGRLYTVYPVNKGKVMASPLQPQSLTERPEYIESLKNAVRIYLNGNTSDTRLLKIQEETGINLNTLEGLAEYMNRFIYVPNEIKNWEKFQNDLAETDDKFGIIEVTNYTINFGIGAQIDGGIIGTIDRNYINTLGENREAAINSLLEKFDKVLKRNRAINPSLNTLQKEFKLITISDTEVKVDNFDNYNDFIKDHSYTANYSHTLPNGNIIYTVQGTLEFDTEGYVKDEPAIAAVQEEFEQDNEGILQTENTSNEEVTFNPNDDFGMLDDLAPRVLSETEEEAIRQSNPDILIIDGLPIGIQEFIVDHVYREIVKRFAKDKDKNAYAYVGVFLNKLVKMRDNDIIPLVDKYPKLQSQLDVVNKLIDNYTIIQQLATDKLQTMNSLQFNGTTIAEITNELENDNIDSEDIADVEEGEVIEYENWQSDRVFKEDYRDKISTKVKNLFTNIPYLNPETLETVKPMFNIVKMVPLETIINDVTAITAYNNTQFERVSEPSLESLLTLLEYEIPNKPYLQNVVEELRNADEQTQNQFVRNMSKHYSHHKLGFKFTNQGESVVAFKNSDSNNILASIENNWLNGLKESELVEEINGKSYINAKEVENLLKDIEVVANDIRTSEGNYILKATNIFERLGLNFDTKLVSDLDTKGIRINGEPKRLTHLFNDSDGFIKIYAKRLSSLKGEDIGEEHPFQDFSALKYFIREIAKLYPNTYSHSFKDVRGRNYFSYSQNKFIVDRFKELRTNNELIENLKKQPFTSTSYMLDMMLTEGNEHYYNYYTIDGLSENQEGKKFSEMSLGEQEEFKVALFFSQNKKSKKSDTYIINTFYPTTSDKSTLYGHSGVGYDFSKVVAANTKQLNSTGIDFLYNTLVKPEILRILSAQRNPDKYNYEGLEQGSKMFILFPELNAKKELFLEGTRELKDIITDKAAQQVIKDFIKTYVDQLVNDRVASWENFGFINNEAVKIQVGNKLVDTNKRTLKFNSNDVVVEAHNYELNNLLANMGIFQLFTTDPAIYFKSNHWKTKGVETREEAIEQYTEADFIQEHLDTFDNMGKRLAADAAPGEDIPNGNNETFNIAHISDSIIKSKFHKYFESILGEKKAGNYTNINSTDAQELTTLAEHLNLMVNLGEINKEQRKVILDKEKKGTLKRKDFKKIFNSDLVLNPMKPRYVKNIWKDGVERRVYIKSSSFPLIKQLTEGLEIDKVRESMEKNNIQRLVYASALKVGGNTDTYSIFDSEGKTRVAIDDILAESKIENLPRSGTKIQQQIPYKEEKTTVSNPTQLIALITSSVRTIKGFTPFSSTSITGNEVQAEIDKRYSELFKIKYEELGKELEYNVKTNTLNIDKLAVILRKEGIQRKYPLYDLLAFKTTNGEFDVPLWATGVSSKIQSMLNSIVDNRVRKHKPRGNSFVLGSNQGFKPVLEGKDAKDYIRNTKGIIFSEKWLKESGGELRPMRIEKGVIQPAEVIAPFRLYDENGNKLNLVDYTREDGTIDMNLLDDVVLESLGFRIPTQGLKSMAYIKIVGFLPENSGDLLLAPSEFVTQMGSDFDVDKLYSLTYHGKLNGKRLVRLTKGDRIKELDNELLDLYLSILKSPLEIVQKQIVAPLDFGMLNDLAEEIYPKIMSESKMRGLSESYQTFKYNNAKIGKEGVGVFSNDMRLMANLADKNIYWTTRKGKPIAFNIGGVSSTILSYPYTKSGRLKSEVIEAYQSLAVDNEKEQGMHKLNINNNTFAFIRAMAMSGIEEDIISYVLAQPIIRRYVELMNLSKDSLTDLQRYEVSSLIIGEYPSERDSKKPAPPKLFTNIPKQVLINQIDGKVNNEIQRDILELFEYLTTKGNELQQIQTSINTFNKGVGKNLFYSLAKEDQIIQLINKERTIANVFSLVGDYINLSANDPYSNIKDDSTNYFAEWSNAKTNNKKSAFINSMLSKGFYPVTKLTYIEEGKTIYRNNLQFIRPTTISGQASIYGTIFNNQIWNNYFPYKGAALINTIEKLKSVKGYTSGNLSLDSELSEKVFSSIKSYLTVKDISTYTNGELLSERKRLFYNTKDNKSLAHIIHELKSDGKLNNSFINRLELDLRTSVLPSSIRYKANIAETMYEREIYQSFNSMLISDKPLGTFNGIDYTLGMLARDLVTSQLINGGVQGANQFLKYVPINYLKSIGFYDSLTKNFSESINPDIIVEQTIQHDPKLVFNPKIATAIRDNTDNIIKINENTIKLGTTLPNPKYFSLKSESNVKGYNLYKLIEEKDESKNIYEKISTLGYKDFLEYNYNTYNATSTIDNNNPQIGVTAPLPNNKNPKEFYKLGGELNRNSEVILEPKSLDIESKYSLDTPNIGTILTEIAKNSSNPVHMFFAQALIKNLSPVADTKFVVSNNIKVDGSYNYNDNTIKINPSNFVDPLDFEKTFLEETIHAYTKKAILENKNGEVLRLRGYRNQAETEIRRYLGQKYGNDKVQEIFDTVDKKVKEQLPLTKEEELVYAVYNVEEFIGRLFRTKKLQELLNEVKATDGKSLWDRFKDFIGLIMKSFGIDIKQGNVLDYALNDILNLILTAEPTTEVKEELKKVNPLIRTIEKIEEHYKLRDANGNLQPILNAEAVVKGINDNIPGLVAEVVEVEEINTFNQLDLFEQQELEEIQIKQETYHYRPLYIVLNNLPKIKPESAIKETGGKVGTNQDINPSYLSKKGMSVMSAAEYLKEDLFSEMDIDESEIRNYIIEILTSKKSDLIEELTGEQRLKELTKKIYGKSETKGKTVKITYKEDLSPASADESNISSFRENMNRRIKTLKGNIEKASANKDYKAIQDLTRRLEILTDRATKVAKIKSITPLITQGEQDMQEIQDIFNRGVSVEDAIYIKEITDYWTNLDQLLFTQDDRTSSLIPKFKEIDRQARIHQDKLHKVEEDYLNKILKKYGKQTTVEEIFKYYQDINTVAGQTLDISRFNNALLSNLLIQLKEANINSLKDFNDLLADLDGKEKLVRKTLKDLGYSHKDAFEMFRQKDAKGRNTNHLVKRYNLDFLKDRTRLKRGLSVDKNKASYQSLLNWSKENTINFDLNLLFKGENSQQRKDYIAKLKKGMGVNHYNEFYNEQKKKIAKYNAYLENFKTLLIQQYNVNTYEELLKIEDAVKALDTWNSTHSPFAYQRQVEKGLTPKESGLKKFNNHDYIVLIPNKEEAFDSNFKTIENNPVLYDFYKYYEEIDSQLQQLLPQKERLKLMYHGLPYLKNMANNAYREKGYKAGLAPIKDAINKGIRITGEQGETINPVNDRVYRNLNINLTEDNHLELQLHEQLKSIEYQEVNNGAFPTDEMREEWRRDKIHELSQKQSFDLPAVLRMYALTTLTYSHKAKVEDYMKLIQNVFERQKEIRRNTKGEVITRDNGTPDIKEASNSFKNTKASLDYLSDTFYGITKKNEGTTTQVVYTSEEKEKIKEIDDKLLKLNTLYQAGTIDEVTYEFQKEELLNIKNSLGGIKVWSKVGDGLLKYIQLKGMGWNFMSSIANVGFGFISNYVEAAGGLLYSRESLNKAYTIVRHSVMRNASFNKYSNPSALKIRNLMNKWDVLKDASKELYNNPSFIQLSDKHQWLEPYNLTQRTEYLNQAPLMIALMLDKKFEHNGKEHSFWEAMGEDGNWNESEYGKEPIADIIKLKLKLDQIIKSNHGNYDPTSALSIKNKFLGRAMSQFRTWMFEGVANRFEKKKYDDLIEEYRKGRYITIFDYVSEYGLKAPLSILQGIIRSATFGKVFGDKNFDNIIGKGKLDRIDAANMRKLMSEINMYMALYISYIIFSTFAEGLDDEEDKYTKIVANTLINQGLRLRTDIVFYLNPTEFKSLMKDLIPVTSLISDVAEWNRAALKFIQGEDEIQAGVYSGHSRLLRESSQMLPFTTQIYKNLNYGIQTFDKN